MTWHALQMASALPDASVSLWCAGEIAHPFLQSCSAHFHVECLPQSEGDLGMRMVDCLQRGLELHERMLLIGSDCPAMATADLARQPLRWMMRGWCSSRPRMAAMCWSAQDAAGWNRVLRGCGMGQRGGDGEDAAAAGERRLERRSGLAGNAGAVGRRYAGGF